MRRIIQILIVLIVVISGLGCLAYFNASFLFARIISNKTHVPVKIKSTAFLESQILMKELWMGNPRDARLPTAMTVETIDVKAPYLTYLDNPVTIDLIHLDNVYFNIQIYNKEQTKGNWQTIISNVQKENKSPLSVEREVHMKKVLITNIQVDLIRSNGELYKLSTIPKIEFDHLNTEKGVPVQEISEILMQKMIEYIFIENGIKSIIEAPVDVIKSIFPFFGQTKGGS